MHLRSRGWPILFDALYGSGLQKAAIAVAADEDDALDIAEKLGWPVVVKPLDASHGRGVLTNIRSEKELRLVPVRARRLGPTPGTVVLVFVFLAAFMLYYFVNWKLLSFLWRIG